MDEIHVHKTKKSICAHFAESPCIWSDVCEFLIRSFALSMSMMAVLVPI